MLRIISLKAEKVFGYIPIDVEFNKDLTFLTGNNGSGKTTALKLISSILQPSFDEINVLTFDKCELTVEVDLGEVICISIIKRNTEKEGESENLAGNIKAKVESENIKAFWEIKYRHEQKNQRPNKQGSKDRSGFFSLYPLKSAGFATREELNHLKERLSTDFVNSEFYSIVNSFNNPVFLDIDRIIKRKIHEDRRSRFYDEEIINSSSFFNAQRRILSYISAKADEKKKLIESFKSNIFTALFKYIPATDNNLIFQVLSIDEIELKRSSTIRSIKSLELNEDIESEVNSFFDGLLNVQVEITKELAKEESNRVYTEWWTNRPHIERINLVTTYADSYQREIDMLDAPLTTIMSIANEFFLDSGKMLRIGANGLIRVEWEGRKDTTKYLSSGEIQIIVIIIHLVFNERQKDPLVFIIDEPELSLHISWQEKFVDAILRASPKSQFIIATHSPAIVSKEEYEAKCIFLEGA